MGAGSETAWKWYHQEKQIRLLMSPPHGTVALIGRVGVQSTEREPIISIGVMEHIHSTYDEQTFRSLL